MFEISQVRASEKNRPEYLRQLDDYARLEYPHEDVRTVSSLALASVKAPVEPPRRWLSFFRTHPVGQKTAARNV
jgi:hypothetical protein